MTKTNGHAGVSALPALTPTEPESQRRNPIQNYPHDSAVEIWSPEIAIKEAIEWRGMLTHAIRDVMTKGVDYGPIPGGDRDALLQPGAHKLCRLFRLKLRYRWEREVEDFTGDDHGGEPFFYYRVRAEAFDHRNEFLAEGIGSCNSWEKKYRYRNAKRKCPACGKSTVIKGRQEYGGGWLCWQKEGKSDGCNAKFQIGDKSITDQLLGDIRNPDVADLVNTIQKICWKRCLTSTTINGTSASEFFTQDLDEDVEEVDGFDPPPTPKTESKRAPVETAAITVPFSDKSSRGDIKAAFFALKATPLELDNALNVLGREIRGVDGLKSADEAAKVYVALAQAVAGRRAA